MLKGMQSGMNYVFESVKQSRSALPSITKHVYTEPTAIILSHETVILKLDNSASASGRLTEYRKSIELCAERQPQSLQHQCWGSTAHFTNYLFTRDNYRYAEIQFGLK